MHRFQKFLRKFAPAAYFVRADTITSGSTDTTADPTKTAAVVAIRFVIIEPQIAIVEATSA